MVSDHHWKYSVGSSGRALRMSISISRTNHTQQAFSFVYKALIYCLKSIKNQLDEEDANVFEFEVDEFISNVQTHYNEMSAQRFNYETEQATLDIYLDDFYTLCDVMDVWINA